MRKGVEDPVKLEITMPRQQLSSTPPRRHAFYANHVREDWDDQSNLQAGAEHKKIKYTCRVSNLYVVQKCRMLLETWWFFSPLLMKCRNARTYIYGCRRETMGRLHTDQASIKIKRVSSVYMFQNFSRSLEKCVSYMFQIIVRGWFKAEL